ncbi:unnamed protein product [Diabrotica balteata]|uniref:C2H2-type domain-containing protein n=1 Tax=Diabrotica balteata TaxID=107213 RepID=A0A9P0GUF1_DIABA|nr:unnamed protein product [Diabrotica balteata]
MALVCEICCKHFSTQSSLNRHLKNVHKKTQKEKIIVAYNFEQFDSKCLEENCNTSYRFTAELRHHLQTIHNKDMETEVLNFSDITEFDSWLNDICKNDTLGFFRHKRLDEKTVYFSCNRSGSYKPKYQERAAKSQGSCKIGSKCTSQIILTHSTDGRYCVIYHKTHYGHAFEVQHIRIPKQTRIDIATKLTHGIAVTRVLDTVRNNFVEDKLSRTDLITRKDINNIKTAYHINIQDGVRHENDSVSVDLLVQECKEVGNEILLYKKQGETFSRLQDMDFCIVIMNKVQENIVQKFGNSVIAIDSTHGLNMYDFELTTLMVMDEFGEGFPAACMFSNRIDTVVHEIFFEHIRERCGVLNPKVFMSDITNVYYNAWYNVMGGEVPNRLFCSWHIDRAWRTNLNKITVAEKRKQVYQTLKILESMHKTLKYHYLDGKVVKRLDKGITAVLKYVRDKIVSRIIKISKGINNCHIQDIHKRHRAALTSTYEIIFNEANVWTIQLNNTTYVVSKKDTACEVPNCQLRCSFCNACVHEYECTCTDFYIRATICKHIHYIILNTRSNDEPRISPEVTLTTTAETLQCLRTLAKSCNTQDSTKHKIQEEINKMNVNINLCKEHNLQPLVLPHILKTMKTANSLLSRSNNESVTNSFPSISSEPSNKKLKKQMSFFSTKKKSKKVKVHISKPSGNETVTISSTLDINSDHDYL